MRQNGLRIFFANSLSDGCHDIEIEPHTHSLQRETFVLKSTTTDDDTRFVIKANEFWESRFNKPYFDKKFNPLAEGFPKSSSRAYKCHESIDKVKYEQSNCF